MDFTNMLRIQALCCILFLVLAQSAQPMAQRKTRPPATATQKKAVAGKAGPVILASKQPDAFLPVVDESFVYWVSDASSRLMKVGKNGGTPVAIVSEQDDINSIAVDESAVYFTTQNQISKVDKQGGAPTVLATMAGQYLTVDKTSVFWHSDGKVMKIGKGGGTPVTLASGIQALRCIIADETSIYWYDYATDIVGKVDKNGGTPAILAKFNSGHDAFAADEASIYIANILGDVKRVSKNGGQPVILVSGQGYIHSMAIDHDHIYFAADTKIKKMDKTGGTPITLISGQDVGKIAIDAEAVYWTNNRTRTVMKMVK